MRIDGRFGAIIGSVTLSMSSSRAEEFLDTTPLEERRHSLPLSHGDGPPSTIAPNGVLNVVASTYRTVGAWKPLASAGRLWPLVFHCLIPADPADYGCYWFDPDAHALLRVAGDISPVTVSSLIRQAGPLALPERRFGMIVVSADLSRMEAKYGNRAAWFALLEAGAASHQIACSATRNGFDSRPIGGFDAHRVRNVIGADVDPLLLVLLRTSTQP